MDLVQYDFDPRSFTLAQHLITPIMLATFTAVALYLRPF
jgi:hypothetical protein